MSEGRPSLSELITVQKHFLRSVNLERDFFLNSFEGNFLFTAGFNEALKQLSKGISDPAYRALCISGPYGSGKSALALYFTRQLRRFSETSDLMGEESLSNVIHSVDAKDNKGWIPIVLTGKREPIHESIYSGFIRALGNLNDPALSEQLQLMIRSISSNDKAKTSKLTEIIETTSKIVLESGYSGTCLVIDELGKLLEFAALKPEQSDIHTLQELAELACRSNQAPFFIVTILHQQLTSYASKLGKHHQLAWAKIQQRFLDVPCALNDFDSIQLVANALKAECKKEVFGNSQITAEIEQSREIMSKGYEDEFSRLCLNCYPIHPTVLLVLSSLFKRFGQNERSLFSFLSVDEPFSLIEWSKSKVFDPGAPVFYRLPQLYDYVRNTLLSGATPAYLLRPWLEIEDALDRVSGINPIAQDLVKTIGLLNIIGSKANLGANLENLLIALPSDKIDRTGLETLISTLVDKRIITFRRYLNAYRLWEGSDINFEELIPFAVQNLALKPDIIYIAKELCPSPPMIARRHSYQKGMIRSFSIIPITVQKLKAEILNDSSQCVIYQCLLENEEEREDISAELASFKNKSVIVLLGMSNEDLKEATRDIEALNWIKQNTPELAGDRIAREELSERLLDAKSAFQNSWDKIFNPGISDTLAYWNGEQIAIRSMRDLTSLLSDACDALYSLAPKVQNELINREKLSSSVAAARNNLIEAMIKSEELPELGIEGYPPERSIYQSVLRNCQIHHINPFGTWEFGPPDETDPGLLAAWNFIDSSAKADVSHPKPVEELFIELTEPPYGLAIGFTPILFCAYLLVNRSRIAIYEDKSFAPELTVPLMERLITHPANFNFILVEISGERALVIERFSRGFNVEPSVLLVVQSLFTRMSSLPDYTKSTANLPLKVKEVREAIIRAKSPEKLLFVDLPKVFHIAEFKSIKQGEESQKKVDEFFQHLNNAFQTLLDCYPKVLEKIKSGIKKIFSLTEESEYFQDKVAKRATSIYSNIIDKQLRVLALRARNSSLAETEYLESLGAAILGQPPSRWNQQDEERFMSLVPQLTRQVKTAEVYSRLKQSLLDDEDGFLLSLTTKDGEQLDRLVRFESLAKTSVREEATKLLHYLDKENTKLNLAALIEALRMMLKAHDYSNKHSQGHVLDDEERVQ